MVYHGALQKILHRTFVHKLRILSAVACVLQVLMDNYSDRSYCQQRNDKRLRVGFSQRQPLPGTGIHYAQIHQQAQAVHLGFGGFNRIVPDSRASSVCCDNRGAVDQYPLTF